MLRLPDPVTFRRMKAATKATVLTTFLNNTVNTDENGLKRVERKYESYLVQPVFKKLGEKRTWERKAAAEKRKVLNVMESMLAVNDLARECVRGNRKNIVCQEHHPLRYQRPDLVTTHGISKSTDQLIRGLGFHVRREEGKITQMHVKIVKKLKDNSGGNVDKDQIEAFQSAEKDFDQMAMNIYWFANNVSEKQRQTYGVYPYFPKRKR